MKILNVSVGLDMRRSGGYAERTFQMSRYLQRKNIESDVLTLDLDLEKQRIDDLLPGKVIALPMINKRFNFPRGGWLATFKAVKESDIVHIIGHWYFINVMAYIAIRYYKKPYVINPAGALPLFGRSKVLKRLFNFFVGNSIVTNADKCIAVVKEEIPHFKGYGALESSIVVIPNAVSQADFPKGKESKFREKYNLSDAPIILFMGRLNTIKGPDILLDAFIKSRKALEDFQLVFVGSDEGLLDSLIAIRKKYKMMKSIHFIGYLSGEDKAVAYHSASLLVIPSRQEAMSIVAIEAGICGTPVLVTDQCGFSEIKNIHPLLEVPVDVDLMAERLECLLLDVGLLAKIRPKWKKYVADTYSWDSIIERYVQMYQTILAMKRA